MTQPPPFIRQRIRISRPEGTDTAIADYVHAAFEPGFLSGLVNGCAMKWHRDAVLKTWRVTREVDRDGHPVDEVTEEL